MNCTGHLPFSTLLVSEWNWQIFLVNVWHSIFRRKYWVNTALHGALPLPVVAGGREEGREKYVSFLLPTREETRKL